MMQKNNSISLHIFTNCTTNAPSTDHIENTFDSVKETFGCIDDVRVWCDPNPNIKCFDYYHRNLKQLFPNVTKTSSLSDGYIRALRESSTDFMLMMEHDWVFVKKPDHSLQEIMHEMRQDDIWYLRFNLRSNEKAGWDKWLKEKRTSNGMLYCETPNLSNNPHLVHRENYIKHALPLLNISKGPHGIEEKLLKSKLTGNVYGGLGHPIMIAHTDGRKKNIK
jgi:hypothetical protein